MVAVRPATSRDRDELARHSAGVAAESEGLGLDVETVRRAVGRILEEPGRGRYFVAEEGQHCVGSCFVTFEWSDWYDQWYWWLQSAYVVPSHRGTRVFSALMAAVGEAARRAGDVRAVRLYVEKGNVAGIRAYRSRGMQELPYLVFEENLV
ncbi:MAG: GNAT family N-acetyltransferase [Thermoplasmatota archaeon]